MSVSLCHLSPLAFRKTVLMAICINQKMTAWDYKKGFCVDGRINVVVLVNYEKDSAVLLFGHKNLVIVTKCT